MSADGQALTSYGMTLDEVREIAFRTAREQGLPETVEDPVVLRQVVQLLSVVPTQEVAS